MKRLLFAFLLICLFCTCKKDPYANLCGGSDPIKNLPWLKAKIDGVKAPDDYTTIRRREYQGQTVFLFQGPCCPFCNCVPFVVFNCDGNPVLFTSEQYDGFSKNNLLASSQIIWHN